MCNNTNSVTGGIEIIISILGGTMKKICILFSIVLMMAVFAPMNAFAAGNYVFMDVSSGNVNYSGLTADEAKTALGTFDSNQTMAVLGEAGGTMIVSGKCRPGGDYTFPAMTGPLTITAVWEGVDYRIELPIENPASGSFKAAGGATLTLGTDTTFTDIILFQEDAQNTIHVPAGLSLTITDSVIVATKPGNDYYWAVEVEKDATFYCSKDAFEKLTITGDGTVIVDGQTVDITATEATAVTTEATTAVTTEKPTATEASEATTKATEKTDAPKDTDKAADTTAASAATTANNPQATDEGGVQIGLIVGIAAAVIAIVAIVIVITKKKHK